MLEVGSTRMKNAGAIMGKILVNISVTWIMFWVIGWNLGFSRNSDDTTNNFVGNSAFNQFANFVAGAENAAAPTQFCPQVGSSMQTQFFFQVRGAGAGLREPAVLDGFKRSPHRRHLLLNIRIFESHLFI